MCYNGKFMRCMEVETAALIFAIFNVLITSLGSVFSVGGLVYTSMVTELAIKRTDEMENNSTLAGVLAFTLANNVLFAILAVCFCIAFSFAVVLIVGLCTRKAHLVKCYFVYGMIKTVCGLTTSIGLAHSADDPAPIIFILCVTYLIYVLILNMIRLTYKKFESEIPFKAFSNQLATIEKY